MNDRKQLIKLEDSDLWQHAQKVCKVMYELNDHLSEEERATLGYRLRGKAFDITADIAEAVGAIDYRDSEFPLSMARKAVFSLKNVYRFLGVQKIVSIDPDIMLSLDELVAKIDHEVTQAWEKIDAYESEKQTK